MIPRPTRRVTFSLPIEQDGRPGNERIHGRHGRLSRRQGYEETCTPPPRASLRHPFAPSPPRPLPTARHTPASALGVQFVADDSSRARAQQRPVGPLWATFVQPVAPALARSGRRLRTVEVALPAAIFSFTLHAEPSGRVRYGVRHPLPLSDGSLSFQLVRHRALLGPSARIAVVAGPAASPPPDASVNASANAIRLGCAGGLESVQLVVGSAQATCLLWHGSSLTVLHVRYDAGRWEWLTATAHNLRAEGTHLLRRPGHAPLVAQGFGARAQLFLDVPAQQR